MNNPIHRRGPCWSVTYCDEDGVRQHLIVQAGSLDEARRMVDPLAVRGIEEIVLRHYSGVLVRGEHQIGDYVEPLQPEAAHA